jgi:hypothetical protein
MGKSDDQYFSLHLLSTKYLYYIVNVKEALNNIFDRRNHQTLKIPN